MTNERKYHTPVKIGNWNEDLRLEEVCFENTNYQRFASEMYVQASYNNNNNNNKRYLLSTQDIWKFQKAFTLNNHWEDNIA